MYLRDWLVYIIECSDGTLYTGITNHLKERLAKHNSGTASKYTRSRLPVHLVAVRDRLTKSESARLEAAVKTQPRHLKITTLRAWLPSISEFHPGIS